MPDAHKRVPAMPCGIWWLNLRKQVGTFPRGLCLAFRLLHPLCAFRFPFVWRWLNIDAHHAHSRDVQILAQYGGVGKRDSQIFKGGMRVPFMKSGGCEIEGISSPNLPIPAVFKVVGSLILRLETLHFLGRLTYF